MSESLSWYGVVWWFFLALSIVLMLYEMLKWFHSRITDLEVWDVQRNTQPPAGEVERMSERIEFISVSKDTQALSDFSKRVSKDIIDQVSFALGLEEDELRKLLSDNVFIKKNFGDYAIMLSFLPVRSAEPPTNVKVEAGKAGRRININASLDEINELLDQVKRWERKYEH